MKISAIVKAVCALAALAAIPAFAGDIDDFLRSPSLGDRVRSYRNLNDLVEEYARIEMRRTRETEKVVREWKDNRYEINKSIRRVINAKEESIARINELKAGRYCSRCGLSQSQIEKYGENFSSHLNKVHGREMRRPQGLIQEEERRFHELDKMESNKRRELDKREMVIEEKYDRLDKEVERDKDTVQKKIEAYVRSGNAADLGALPEEQPRRQQSSPKQFELNDKQWWGDK